MRLAPSLALLGLAASTVAFAPSAPAQPVATGDVAYMATDVAGDANGVNGQGVEDVGSTATPVDVADADLLGARLTSRFRAVPGPDGPVNVLTGVEFRTALSALPASTSVPVLHRFRGSIDGCELWVQFAVGIGGGAEHGDASVRLFGAGCGIADDPVTGLAGNQTVRGNGITYAADSTTGEAIVTLDATAAPEAVAELLTPDALYLLDGLEVRHHSAAGFTAPVVDELDGSGGFAYLGEDIPPYEDGQGDDGGDDDEPVGSRGTPSPFVVDDGSVCERHGAPTGTTEPTGSDRTGVDDDALTLAVHAPATGAAPLPTTSYENARDLYWRAVTELCGDEVLGRSSVEVEFRDDKYAPDAAIQQCRELSSRAFLLVGASGTDQVQACGQLAAQASFPYLSPGVTESGLSGNPWYFAQTTSWPQQGGLLAQYVAADPHGLPELGPDAAIGTLITNTPNFEDARDGWFQGLADAGLTSISTFEHPKGDTSWYADTAQRFQADGVEVVYVLTSPVDLINFARTASERFGYDPLYIGVGSDLSLSAVARSGCGDLGRGVDRAVWLSGTPALDAAPTAFLDAAETLGAPADDVALRLWATAEQQHALLAGYGETFGTDLTREDFRVYVEGGAGAVEGTYPTASWAPHDHFTSGSGVHVVQTDCRTRSTRTLQLDATGF